MEIEEFTSDGLLSYLTGVTALLDGLTHKVYKTTSKDSKGNNIHLAQTGTKFKKIR